MFFPFSFSFFLPFCLLSFSARQIMYSCILKSDVKNVTVFARVVVLVFEGREGGFAQWMLSHLNTRNYRCILAEACG